MTTDLIEELRDTFDYHPGGYLIRKSTGRPCGRHSNNGNGYARVRFGKRKLYAHRIIYAIVHGEMPEGEMDHVNGNRIDNRIENLREVSHSENQHNHGVYKTNSSGFPGVCWHAQSQKWRAQIQVNNKNVYLGLFEDITDAVEARKLAKMKYHPTSPEAASILRKEA